MNKLREDKSLEEFEKRQIQIVDDFNHQLTQIQGLLAQQLQELYEEFFEPRPEQEDSNADTA